MFATGRTTLPLPARPGPAARALAAVRERPNAVFLAVALAGLAAQFIGRGPAEWDTVFVASARHLVAGDDFYDLPIGFAYPPFQSLFALPVVGLPRAAQRAAWFAVNAVCLVWLLRAAWRLAGGGPLRFNRDHREHFACWLGLGAGMFFALNSLSHQQTDVVLAALVVGGIDRFARGRWVRGAALVGLAAAMKCTPLLFAPYLVVRGRWAAAGCLVAVALGASLAPDLVARPKTDGTWLGRWYACYIAPMARPDYPPGMWASHIVYNQSVVGMANRWTRTTWEPAGATAVVREVPPTADLAALRRWVLAAAVGCGAVALAGIVTAWRRGGVEFAGTSVVVWESGTVIAGMLLFSPMSSPAHFGLLVLPGFALARAAVVGRCWWAWPPVAVALLGGLSINKDLWGDKLYTLGLWYGAATWATAATLFGCVAGLMIGPKEALARSTDFSESTAKKKAA